MKTTGKYIPPTKREYTLTQMETAARIAAIVSKIPEDRQSQFLAIAEAVLLGVGLAQRHSA